MFAICIIYSFNAASICSAVKMLLHLTFSLCHRLTKLDWQGVLLVSRTHACHVAGLLLMIHDSWLRCQSRQVIFGGQLIYLSLSPLIYLVFGGNPYQLVMGHHQFHSLVGDHSSYDFLSTDLSRFGEGPYQLVMGHHQFHSLAREHSSLSLSHACQYDP